MNLLRILFVTVLLISIPAFSAQLVLNIKDSHGKPVVNAVAALVPEVPVDYSTVPPADMDQRDKKFVPGVLAIRVNTLVRFPNSDDIRHHVYSFSPAKKFELRLYHGLTAEPVLFDKPGTVVLGCNIHDSMVGYIYVLETDYFSISDAQGNVSINAAAGQYRLQIHHPQLTGEYPESNVKLGEAHHQQKNIVLDNLISPKKDEAADEFSNLF